MWRAVQELFQRRSSLEKELAERGAAPMKVHQSAYCIALHCILTILHLCLVELEFEINFCAMLSSLHTLPGCCSSFLTFHSFLLEVVPGMESRVMTNIPLTYM